MKSIAIKSLELVNYRQFIKETVDFSTQSGKNIIVVEGKNGFGKSNIFNAITWCFFGVEEHLRPDDRSLPMCNTKVFKELKVNGSVKTSVKVVLDTDDGLKEIERTIITHKTGDGAYYSDKKSELKIAECTKKNWKISPYPEYVISRILPKDMRHFFFIDGEKLRQLFENINPEQVRKSIFDLSQITLLQNAIDHLDYVKGSFRTGIKGKEPQVDIFEEKLEELKKKVEDEKEYVDKLQHDRNEAFVNKRKLDQQLEGIDSKNIQILEEKRKALEAQITSLDQSISEKKQDYLDYLFKVAPSLMLKDPIDKTLKKMAALKDAGKLPPKIEATFITELLKKEECICGVDLSSKVHKDNKKKLEDLLKNNEKYSNLAEDTINLRYALHTIMKEGEKYDEISGGFQTKIRKIEEDYAEKQKLLTEVKTKIGSVDSDKIRAIHNEREKLESMITEYNSRIGRAKENIRYSEKSYKEVEKLFNRELQKKDKFKGTREKIALCDIGINNLQTVKDKIMHEIREEIQNGTKKYFSNLITEKNFSNFQINSDYELIIEQDGFNAITSLSAAETLCLGYSFMSALRQGSKFAAPIIIDTPLAKIDREYRINVADWFKKSLKDAQVILLVTNTEYTDEFRKAVKPSISSEFILEYNEKNKTSEVKKYGR